MALLLTISMATFANANATSSDLLLPYFEVDLTGGLTTYVSVVNSTDGPVPVRITVYTNWGIELLGSSVTLDNHEVYSTNLSSWVIHGKLPDRTLDEEELEHVQAALSGQRSPKDDKYYSTEAGVNLAVGYLTIRVDGSPRVDALFGKYFVVDPLEDFAQGEVLVNIDRSVGCGVLCERHGLRFLDGGGFDSGTDVIIWTWRRTRPSDSPYFPSAQKINADVTAYNDDGDPIDQQALDLLPLEVVKVSELGLSDPFGWLDLLTKEKSFIAVRYTASNRFSAALQTVCLPPDPGPGLPEPKPSIRIEKSTNGEDADTAPGPMLNIGDQVVWEYVVVNRGNVALTDVIVIDDQGVAVECPEDSLAVGESMTCTGSGVAVKGQYANTGTVTAWGGDEHVEDSDPSHYYCIPEPRPCISLEKFTNDHDADTAPGPTIAVGDPVIWTYVITNCGEMPLDRITIDDTDLGQVGCPVTVIQPGESVHCEAHGTATAGQYRNVGTVTGTAPDGQKVKDSDPSHYFGEPVNDDQGCTPGYWKNHTGSWPPTGYLPNRRVDSAFAQAAAYPSIASSSLTEALDFGGGTGVEGAARNLLRASVAALLNASHPDISYPWTPFSVVDKVNAALASGDRDTMLALAASLDVDNNLGCPLN